MLRGETFARRCAKLFGVLGAPTPKGLETRLIGARPGLVFETPPMSSRRATEVLDGVTSATRSTRHPAMTRSGRPPPRFSDGARKFWSRSRYSTAQPPGWRPTVIRLTAGGLPTTLFTLLATNRRL